VVGLGIPGHQLKQIIFTEEATRRGLAAWSARRSVSFGDRPFRRRQSSSERRAPTLTKHSPAPQTGVIDVVANQQPDAPPKQQHDV